MEMPQCNKWVHKLGLRDPTIRLIKHSHTEEVTQFGKDMQYYYWKGEPVDLDTYRETVRFKKAWTNATKYQRKQLAIYCHKTHIRQEEHDCFKVIRERDDDSSSYKFRAILEVPELNPNKEPPVPNELPPQDPNTTIPFNEISEYVDIMESEEYQIATTAEQRATRRKQQKSPKLKRQDAIRHPSEMSKPSTLLSPWHERTIGRKIDFAGIHEPTKSSYIPQLHQRTDPQPSTSGYVLQPQMLPAMESEIGNYTSSTDVESMDIDSTDISSETGEENRQWEQEQKVVKAPPQ